MNRDRHSWVGVVASVVPLIGLIAFVVVVAGWRVGAGAVVAVAALVAIPRYQARGVRRRPLFVAASALAGFVAGALMLSGVGAILGTAIGATLALPAQLSRRTP